MAIQDGQSRRRRCRAVVRLATHSDAAAICALIHELAEYEKRTRFCEVTPEKLAATLWEAPPFQGPTVLILELFVPNETLHGVDQSLESTDEQDAHVLTAAEEADEVENTRMWRSSEGQAFGHTNGFQTVMREVMLSPGMINDPALDSFRPSVARAAGSEIEGRSTVAGYVLLFPNYPSFLAKPCFYIEDLYVRQPYRGLGLGTLLLKTVAAQAVQQGAGRVEWTVLDWNANAIKFYEGIGADLIPHEWRHCHLAGKALHSFSSSL
ncbi:hypothetical protein M758_4G165100 [Ceratodon purpureus]|nr:hypothetical protein M758_4G165100 [Ceratodon purpureus]